jgi:glycosyltransferase involved in cell wall biosynthesis
MAAYLARGGVAETHIRVVRNPVEPYAEARVTAERNADLFFVGRLAHEKGVDLAAEAAARAGRRLQVVGDGELRSELEKRFPEAVFHGWRSHAEIGALIVKARALIVSSRLPETFTLVAHEAMRSGVPVVAFSDVDCGDAARIGAAVAVPPRSVDSLVRGIRTLDSDAAARRLSETAFAQGGRFSNTYESWRDQMLGHYAELIAGAGRRAPEPAAKNDAAPLLA